MLLHCSRVNRGRGAPPPSCILQKCVVKIHCIGTNLEGPGFMRILSANKFLVLLIKPGLAIFLYVIIIIHCY